MNMKLIDLEAHFFTQSFLDYLRKNDEFPRIETIRVDGVQKDKLMLHEQLWALRHATLKALMDVDEIRLADMDANGWSVDQEMNMMGQRMLHASKGGRSLMVQVMERDGGSHAMVHLGEDG